MSARVEKEGQLLRHHFASPCRTRRSRHRAHGTGWRWQPGWRAAHGNHGTAAVQHLAVVGFCHRAGRLWRHIHPGKAGLRKNRALVARLVIAFTIWSKARPSLAGFSRGFFLALAVITLGIGYVANCFINGRTIVTLPFANIKVGPIDIKVGPVPRGTPISLMMSMDPTSKNVPKAVVSLVLAMAEIKKRGLTGDEAWEVFSRRAGQPLMDASKCPDFVLDRGHLFGETLDPDPVKNDQAKEDLIAFLKIL